MSSVFEQRAQIKQKEKKQPNGSAFQQRSTELGIPEEPWYKQLARTASSAATGYASGTPLGLAANFSNLLALGDVNDPEEMERIKEISEREGIPFDEEKYKQAAQAALGSFPTPHNIARQAEEATGLPLTAKEPYQKLIETAFTAGRAQPGALSQKAVAGVTTPAVSHVAQELGVPEPIADILGYTAGGYLGNKTPEVDVKFGNKTKPSGLSERGFESITKPREITAKKKVQIDEALESDFKNISENIISESPIKETAKNIKENPTFKKEIGDQFKQVEELAKNIPEKINTDAIKKTLLNKFSKKDKKGFLPSEYDKDFSKFTAQFIRETPTGEVSAIDLVNQYRKNNKALSEFFEPSQSKAFNRAKKDALLEYNQAIADTIQSHFPDSEFSNLFKETNKKWSEISDVEAMNSFVDRLFEKGPNFKKGQKFFESENQSRPFKRALGEKGFKEFEQVMTDLMTTKTPYNMLKVAEKQGWSDLAKNAGLYLINPKLGTASTGLKASKLVYEKLINSMLHKPKLSFELKKGVDNLKKGNFDKAEKNFIHLNNEINQK